MSQTMSETLLLKQPTLSAEEIAFLYAGELWLAGPHGEAPRRLTAQKGRKIAPYFSPDGQWIAFSADYDGSLSVYLIPRTGGSPRRLTYHPEEDFVRGWSPDGKSVLFASTHGSIHQRVRRLYRISVEGGLPEALPVPMGDRAALSPDGSRLAYTPFAEPFWSWKRYRGGMTTPIWVLDLATSEQVQVPHENASDTFPCWLGDALYFLSDRAGTMNLFRWTPGSTAVEMLSQYQDFDIRSLTAGDGALVYEQGGRVHRFDPLTSQSKALTIAITADLPYTRPHYQKAARMIQNADISPSGQRALFEARGEIFSVPASKGEIRNLTHTPGAAERYPAWSPDGKSIAYFSDASGEYQLVIADQKGAQQAVIALEAPTFFYHPVWSPDSQKIAFTDKALHLYTVELATRSVTLIDTDTYDHPLRSLDPAWSPDSQWLAYTRRLDNQLRAVFVRHLNDGQSHQVTDGMSDATSACFSRDGKYLFFTASINYGLNIGWLDMTSYERPVARSLYLAVLNRADDSPLKPESDEEDEQSAEKATDINEENSKQGAAKKGEENAAENKIKAVPVVTIDLDGLDQRILALPVPPRDYRRLQASEGKLFYMETLPNPPIEPEMDTQECQLSVYDLKERKAEVFIDRLLDYWISADGKKLLYHVPGEPKFAIAGTEKKPDPNEGVLNLDGLEVMVDPRAEWRQIFHEAYRIHRDYFYDAGMHGLDLSVLYQTYLPFLEHVGHRDDLNYLLAEFSGELVVGHAYVGMGDIPAEESRQVGLLGADYELTPEGYYRFKQVYPGLNWHPELRAPLTGPGVDVKAGEYLLAVNGRPLRAPTDLFSLFEKTADKITEITVGSETSGAGARTVSVRPLASETPLRHWNWVEANRRRVDALSQGRVAYIYLPDTAVHGYENFNRYFFSQLDKEAMVIDERYNGGGSVADYVVDMLNRPILSYWATRQGKVFSTPNAAMRGPKVMIINELAGSGGDALPLFFRRRGLGLLVGKRTWGGLIGIYDYPVLIDGGFFSSPRLAIFSPQGAWEVENEGVAPDIEVEQDPKSIAEGRDPQLERAVAVVLDALQTHPLPQVTRPASVQRAIKKA